MKKVLEKLKSGQRVTIVALGDYRLSSWATSSGPSASSVDYLA